ncbi:MAG TPA: cytochrome P450 [Ensifer sp.]|nr:cytochrome P450 [Ensifer sp.]
MGNPDLKPVYDVDLYDESVLRDPYPHYARIRDLGPAVWLPRNNLWAVGRHADVRKCLADHELFQSGKGVAANAKANEMAPGNLLASDPPLHDKLRKIVGAPLTTKALQDVNERIAASADELVARLVERQEFDGMLDLAQYLPLSIVTELVGMPDFGRENQLKWAASVFDMLGGDNERARKALPVVLEMREYTNEGATEDKVRPGSWVAKLYDAARSGLIESSRVQVLMRDYLGPSLDTTIFATGHLMYQLGKHPEQWALLRQTPSAISNAINEAVRLESPIRGFTRTVSRDTDLDGVALRKDDRVLILYASANRDERRWSDPASFDVKRALPDHVGFGHGIHACAGMQLARLEMKCILMAMVRKVARIEVGEPTLAMNNVLRGFSRLPMRFVPAL